MVTNEYKSKFSFGIKKRLTCALTVIPRSLSTLSLSSTCLLDDVADMVFVNSSNLFRELGRNCIGDDDMLSLACQRVCFCHDLSRIRLQGILTTAFVSTYRYVQ